MSGTSIATIHSWEVLDSRGKPTVAAKITLRDGTVGTAMVPSGASAGSHEAVELRDGGRRHDGNGVLRAVAGVLDILAPRLIGLDGSDADGIDAELRAADASPGYATLGANAILSLSLAAWRAAAAARRVSLARLLGGAGALELPVPMVNVISGGAHAGGLIDVQDFLVVPHGAHSFAEAIEWAAAVRREARGIALARGQHGAVLVADEGGLGLPLATNRSALELLTEAIERAGLEPGTEASIAIDVAASELFENGRYRLRSENRRLSANQLIDELEEWATSFPVVSIEDPLAEDDWDGWERITARLAATIELVGDDLFVTNPDRLQAGIDRSAANSVLVKVNQNGLVSGGREVVELAKRNGYRTVVSARSGETEDSWLSDLAVGWRAGQIKVGSTHRSERNAKWNRLLEFEATEDTTYSGPWARDPRTGIATPRKPIG